MTTHEVDERIRAILAAHLEVDPARLSPATLLGDDLCVDSLTAVELLMVLEDDFDIALPEERVGDLKTYGDLVEVVTEEVGAG